jgi:hypothetical protein
MKIISNSSRLLKYTQTTTSKVTPQGRGKNTDVQMTLPQTYTFFLKLIFIYIFGDFALIQFFK